MVHPVTRSQPEAACQSTGGESKRQQSAVAMRPLETSLRFRVRPGERGTSTHVVLFLFLQLFLPTPTAVFYNLASRSIHEFSHWRR